MLTETTQRNINTRTIVEALLQASLQKLKREQESARHRDHLRRRADFITEVLALRGITAFTLSAQYLFREDTGAGAAALLILDQELWAPTPEFLEIMRLQQKQDPQYFKNPITEPFSRRFSSTGVELFSGNITEPDMPRDEEFVGSIGISERLSPDLKFSNVLERIGTELLGPGARRATTLSLTATDGRLAIEFSGGRLVVEEVLPVQLQLGLVEKAMKLLAREQFTHFTVDNSCQDEWDNVLAVTRDRYHKLGATQMIHNGPEPLLEVRKIFAMEMATGAVSHEGKTIEQIDPDRLGRGPE